MRVYFTRVREAFLVGEEPALVSERRLKFCYKNDICLKRRLHLPFFTASRIGTEEFVQDADLDHAVQLLTGTLKANTVRLSHRYSSCSLSSKFSTNR